MRRLIYVLLLVALPVLPVFAQENVEDTTVLGTVLVTDTGKKMKLLETNSAVTILTEKDIKNSGQTKTEDLLASVPGVTSQFGNITIRGIRSSTSGGPAIYVDGRLINKGMYFYSDLNSIPLGSIAKIEIIKSPSPVLYGENAARGVILITTKKEKKSEKPISINLSAEYGSWNTYKGAADISGELYGFNYNLVGNALKTDGYRHTDDDTKNVDLNLGRKAGNFSYDVFSGASQTEYKSVGALTTTIAEDNPRHGAMYEPSEHDDTSYNAGFNVKFDNQNFFMNTSFRYDYTDECYKLLNKSSDNSKYKEDRDYSVSDFRLSGGKRALIGDSISNITTLLLSYKYDTLEQDRSYYTSTYAGSSTELKSDLDSDRKMLGIALNNDLTVGLFRLECGLKYNKVNYALDNKNDQSFDKDFGNDFEWNASASLSPIDKSNLFFTYNRSKVYGSLYYYKAGLEKEYEATMPDNLKPETYNSFEIGFKHQLHRAFNYSLIGYYTKIEDKFIAYYDESGTYKAYGNAGTSIHKGVEIEIDGRPFDLIGYRAGFSTVDAEWDKATYKTDDLSGKKLTQIPEYEYRFGVDIHPLRNTTFGSLVVALDVYGFSEQYEDYDNELKMDPACFVGVKVTWSKDFIEVFGTCTNLLDKNYIRYSNSTGKDHDDTNQIAYPDDGRYIGGGVTLKI